MTDRSGPLAAVVYNPVKVDLARLRGAVAWSETRHGWRPSLWLETSEEDPGAGQTREALAAGADVVVAAGGDGTVRVVAEAVRGSGAAFGLIPAGTGNLLARNLDLPLDSVEAQVRAVFGGEDRPIDMGLIRVEREDGEREDMAFLVMAGAGLDAQMIANADPLLKKRVGWLAYVDAIRRALLDRNQIRLRYALDDRPEGSARVHTVLVGNCGSLPGNIVLLPEATVDDGMLDIVALRPEGFVGWIQIWLKIVWENGVLRRSETGRKLLTVAREIRALRYFRGTRLTVRLAEPTEMELDGDTIGKVVAFRCTVDEHALRVRLPVGHRLPGH